jgi:hypothetical protein
MTAMPGFAGLGDNASSVPTEQARTRASVRIIPGPLYSVQESKTPSGTAVRQFVSASGTVFAVSWEGAAPDLQQLLGRYFDEYVAYVKSRPANRGRGTHLDTGDLVIETGGHMRFIVGRAYLRSQMPQGVARDEIR